MNCTTHHYRATPSAHVSSICTRKSVYEKHHSTTLFLLIVTTTTGIFLTQYECSSPQHHEKHIQHRRDRTRLSREAHPASNRSDTTVRCTPHAGREHGVEENRTKHKSPVHRITTPRHTSRREFGHDSPTHDTARYIETTHTILCLHQCFVLNRLAHSFHLLVIRSQPSVADA